MNLVVMHIASWSTKGKMGEMESEYLQSGSTHFIFQQPFCAMAPDLLQGHHGAATEMLTQICLLKANSF